MADQIALYAEEPKKRKPDKTRRNWEDRFQRWCNAASQESGQPTGKCGYSYICDYCTDPAVGRPCVRALNALCRDCGITIDYGKQSYSDAWEGDFDNGKNPFF